MVRSQETGQGVLPSHVILQKYLIFFRFNSTLFAKTSCILPVAVLQKFWCCGKKLWCDLKKLGREYLLFVRFFKYLIIVALIQHYLQKQKQVLVLLKFWCFSKKRWCDLKKLDRRKGNCKKNGEEENWTNFWRIFLQNHSLPQPISVSFSLDLIFFGFCHCIFFGHKIQVFCRLLPQPKPLPFTLNSN